MSSRLARIERRIHARDVRCGAKVGPIGPKWNKSGTFSDQISVHFGLDIGSEIQAFVPFEVNLIHFGVKSDIFNIEW